MNCFSLLITWFSFLWKLWFLFIWILFGVKNKLLGWKEKKGWDVFELLFILSIKLLLFGLQYIKFKFILGYLILLFDWFESHESLFGIFALYSLK